MSAALRRTLILLVALAAAVLVSGLPASAAPAGTGDDEAGFVTRINADRAASGLGGLRVSSDLTAVARRHAQRMASAGSHFHNSNLANEVSGWMMLGENVGQGPTVDGLHRAFMESPSHRANILRREFSQVGIGVVRDASGRIFVVEVFRQPAAASAPAPAPAPAPKPAPAPAPAPAPKPAPAPAPAPAPTTTVPPAPTTTVPPAPEPTVARPLANTPDTLGATAAVAAQPVVASVELPVETARPVTGPATVAGALILGLLAVHAGRIRRLVQAG